MPGIAGAPTVDCPGQRRFRLGAVGHGGAPGSAAGPARRLQCLASLTHRLSGTSEPARRTGTRELRSGRAAIASWRKVSGDQRRRAACPAFPGRVGRGSGGRGPLSLIPMFGGWGFHPRRRRPGPRRISLAFWVVDFLPSFVHSPLLLGYSTSPLLASAMPATSWPALAVAAVSSLGFSVIAGASSGGCGTG